MRTCRASVRVDLALLRVDLHFLERAEEVFRVEDVRAGVDLGDLLLLFRRVVVLDDAEELARLVARDPPVARRVVDAAREDRGAGARLAMGGDHRLDRVRRDEGRVAREHEDEPVAALDRLLGGEDGVTGSLLFGLAREGDARPGGLLDGVFLVADDDHDVLHPRRAEGAQDMVDEGAAQKLVEHLGLLGLHPDAAARGEDDGANGVERHNVP
jgi:hypothetical protein